MKHTILFSLALMLVMFTACKEERALTEKECLEFSKALEKSINNGDTAFFDSHIDATEMSKRISEGLDMSVAEKRTLKNELVKSLNLGASIVGGVVPDGAYKFLRLVKDKKGNYKAYFRLENSGFNYHILELGARDGDVVIKDMHVMYSGGLLSQIMHNIYAAYSEAEEKNLYSLSQTSSFHMACSNESTGEIVRLYHQLPEGEKMELINIAYYLEAAVAEDDEMLDTYVERFLSRYPGNPTLGLFLHSYYADKGDYNRQLEMLAAIDSAVGGDPMLTVMQGHVCYNMGDMDRAEELVLKGIREEKDRPDGYKVLVYIHSDNGEMEKAIAALDELKRTASGKLDFFLLFEASDDFKESKEFIAWASRNKWDENNHSAEELLFGDGEAEYQEF